MKLALKSTKRVPLQAGSNGVLGLSWNLLELKLFEFFQILLHILQMASENDGMMKFRYLSEWWNDGMMKFRSFQNDEMMKWWNFITFQNDEMMKWWNFKPFRMMKWWNDEISDLSEWWNDEISKKSNYL